VIVYYGEQLLYPKGIFEDILMDEENFSLKLIEKLNSTVSSYGEKSGKFDIKF